MTRHGWGWILIPALLGPAAGCLTERDKPTLRSGGGPWGRATVVSHVSRAPGNPGSVYRVQPGPGTGGDPGGPVVVEPEQPVVVEPVVVEPAVEACVCDITAACEYDCPCDSQCPCECDRDWSCESGCACDPECQAVHGDCAMDGVCNERCPEDPDCGGSEPAEVVVEECACDATWACDYDCSCDPQCPCECDQNWLCDSDCGCDPECRPEYGDCTADGTCNARCPADPDCGGVVEPPVVASLDLESYRRRCVDGINEYRATLGLPPLGRWSEAEGCVDGESRSDSESGQAHGSFGACRERAQNACPYYPSLESTVGLCLQQMWDEGPGEPFSEHGHFLNMSSTEFSEVACGFYEMPNGEVWAIQDFR